jgi:hypothetical protein
MAERVVFTQWHWSRLGLIPATIAAFAIPIFAVQGFNDAGATGFQILFLLRSAGNWAAAYPVLAAGVGLLLGLTAWSADHRGRHVYARSLPVSRTRFVFLRYAAGLILACVPVIALWLGAVAASIAVELPVTLQAYPHSLTLRFLLAAVLSYTIFFAVASSTSRVAGAMLLIIVVAIGVQFFSQLFGMDVDVAGAVGAASMEWPGPLEIFGGRWMLIDF